MAAQPLQLAGKAMSTGPTTVERMNTYQRRVHCGGDGFHAVGKSWLWCEACGGLGRLMTPKVARFLEL
jgi:tartrate dehydratase beta subunit/fumarate hydratase class I family protein